MSDADESRGHGTAEPDGVEIDVDADPKAKTTLEILAEIDQIGRAHV